MSHGELFLAAQNTTVTRGKLYEEQGTMVSL